MNLSIPQRQELEAIGEQPDDSLDLAGASLALASLARPGVPRDPYVRHLEKIATEVGDYVASGPAQPPTALRLEALTQVIARRYGYGGADDAHEDPESGNLMRVIDHRRGLPVTLGIIYIHAARAQGWQADGVDFPARFLVRIEHEGERIIFDPFDGAAEMRTHQMRELLKAVTGKQAEITPAHYAAMNNRAVLLRAQNNVKLRLIRADRLEDALRTVEAMQLTAPGATALWREAGLLHTRLENIPEAVAALEEFLRRNNGDQGNYRASILLQELRGKLQ